MSLEADFPLPFITGHSTYMHGPMMYQPMGYFPRPYPMSPQAVAQMLAQQKMVQGILAMQNSMNKASAASGQGTSGDIMSWLKSARYDDPVGGQIDTFSNRLCFDSVCKHDPENSENLSMEWLRRAIPMQDNPRNPDFQQAELILPRPDREFSLVPFQDIGREGATKVHVPRSVDITRADLGPMLFALPYSRSSSINSFL
jgi:hypothetical protein